MFDRKLLRANCAAHLNTLSLDELFYHWRITRVSDLTGLDQIGIPVFSVCRPEGQAVSVNAGKALTPELARAGAIAEGAEFHTFETPASSPPKKRVYATANDLGVDPELLPWAKRAARKEKFEVELVSRFNAGWTQMPSDIFWLSYPDRGGSELFQQTSNGNAVGPSFQDAHLAGIYECVERDATTCFTHIWNTIGRTPPLIDLESVPESCKSVISKIEAANLEVMVFYCTLDILFPVFWAVILDPFGGLSPFAGWGCAIEGEEALLRALLEAVQSRAVYISGARDDVFRRNFEFSQNLDQVELRNSYRDAPKIPMYFDHVFPAPPTADEELSLALRRLGDWRKHLYHLTTPIYHLVAVKTVILGLEPPISPRWTPSKRASRWLESTRFSFADPVSTVAVQNR
jgi:YcaO-like protein with predicted kinase domain